MSNLDQSFGQFQGMRGSCHALKNKLLKNALTFLMKFVFIPNRRAICGQDFEIDSIPWQPEDHPTGTGDEIGW
jgi:hypothetical protein